MELERQKSYTFDSYSLASGRRAIGWSLADVVGYPTAVRLGFDVDATHARVIGSLPPGVSKDPTKLTYYIFRSQDSREECIAKEWIREDSIEEFSNAEVHVVVRGELISVSDKERIQLILAENGYSDFTITLVGT